MRKSFVALALLVGAATMLTTLAFAQESWTQDQGAILKSASTTRAMLVTKAARLGTSGTMACDTMFVGHTAGSFGATNPWHIGTVPDYAPGKFNRYEGMWDFDTYDNSTLVGSPGVQGGTGDSMQGWVPFVVPNVRSLGTIPDTDRPWRALDWGNRMNAGPVQGRTPGIISAWHADNGAYPLNTVIPQSSSNSWTPLAGSKSAWCGLRQGDDKPATAFDDPFYGGTGNYINGDRLFGREGTVAVVLPGKATNTNFPGYGNQWDQLLYRDVRVNSGTPLIVSFLYETQMDSRADPGPATMVGWFEKDPLSMAAGNFIGASAVPARAPVDSFMVYVGVPTDPTNCMYSDTYQRPIFDLKRRWFSEVIAIDMPYTEILTTSGRDSAYRTSAFTRTVPSAVIDGMIGAQGAANGGGVIRIVFRCKTNANYSDEQNTGGSYVSTNQGAVRIDQVSIVGATPALATSGFEDPGDINNNIEVPNSNVPGMAVGEGYALAAWHATGKPPKLMSHLHPLAGGNIAQPGDPINDYAPLNYADLCGAWDSPIRQCNINDVVFSSTDHDLFEAAGGASGTPFKENRGGLISPTINLWTPAMPGLSDIGLDNAHVTTTAKWVVFYDIYTGIFADFYAQGNLHNTTMMSWPTLQKNGAEVWGGLGITTGMYWWGDRICVINWDEVSPFINTSKAGGIPDSVKIVIQREQRCISVGAPNCSPTDGHYTDNVTLGFPCSAGGSSDNIVVDIWDWYSDAFPANQTAEFPGTVAFDTCGAYILSAFQRATPTTDLTRSCISGDSMFIKTSVSSTNPMRMDCVFRIYPGPGNYVTLGNKTSGLRKVPASTAPALTNDNSFWGQYMGTPGLFSKGTHPTNGWNADTWNSVRVDTVEINIFPATAISPNLPAIAAGSWMSTIHDDDPRLGTLFGSAKLGIEKNRCFLLNPAAGQVVNETNIICNGLPPSGWLTTPPAGSPGNSGYDPATLGKTLEYTKIFPDGLLTPGSSIQYFFRMGLASDTDPAAAFVMVPDTNRVYPQPQSGPNYDGQRWANVSILPDRWKEYNGLAQACLLVVDQQDRRGNERNWVGIADTLGYTQAVKYGAHNGWHATGAYIADSDGSNNYTNEVDCGTDPGIRVWKNGGQPGSMWDLYNVTSAESPSGSTTAIGSRLAPKAIGLQAGRDTRQGPTPEMLKAYYRMLFFLCGDMKGAFFGAIANKGAKDIEIVQDFLGSSAPRGAWFMGDAFVEGHDGYSALHDDFLNRNLGVSLRDPSYFALSGSQVLYPDLIPSAAIPPTTARYTVENSCSWTNDVLYAESIVNAGAGTTYENLGACVGCIAGVFTPSGAGHLYTTLVDGWSLPHLYGKEVGNSVGRMKYIQRVQEAFASICSFAGSPTVEVMNPDVNVVKAIDFLGNIGNNPMVAGGKAVVYFGLAKADRVEVKVYDVTGRLVRTLADRNFKAGPQSLVWDGSNDQGQVVSRGVYFTQVKFANSRFVDAKKVTVLK